MSIALIILPLAFLWIGRELWAGSGALDGAELGWAWLSVLLAVVVPVTPVWALAGRALRSLRAGDSRGVLRTDGAARVARLISLGLFACACVFGRWPEAAALAAMGIPGLQTIIGVSPFVLALAGIAWAVAPIEARIIEARLLSDLLQGRAPRQALSRGGFVLEDLRMRLGVLGPPAVAIHVWTDLVEWWGPGSDAAFLAAQMSGVAAVFLLTPLLARWTLRLQPLQAGHLRDRVESMVRAEGVRAPLRVWPTRGVMANAVALGLLPGLRALVVTDGLLERLREDEVLAVVAHELGHFRRWHLVWLLLALMSASAAVSVSVLVLGSVLLRGVGLGGSSGGFAMLEIAATVASLVAVFASLGFVSKRFEWQADAFAVRVLSGHTRGGAPVRATAEASRAMEAALRAVSRASGASIHRSDFRHGSVATRIARLRRLPGLMTDDFPQDASARWVKTAIVMGLAGSVGLSAVLVMLDAAVSL